MLMLTSQDIRKIREEMGWSATALAAKLGVTENAVRRWECGNRHPRYDTMVQLNELWEQVRSAAGSVKGRRR